MFNPEARWDRDLPREATNPELLEENISVFCLFSKGRIMPRHFIWRKHIYQVEKVLFFWKEKQGRDTINYFSLSTAQGTYQVSFSSISFCWKLNRVIES